MAHQPEHPEETAYAALALLSALVNVLLEKQLIGQDDLDRIRTAAFESAKKVNNNSRDRTAKFILSWVPDKEGE